MFKSGDRWQLEVTVVHTNVHLHSFLNLYCYQAKLQSKQIILLTSASVSSNTKTQSPSQEKADWKVYVCLCACHMRVLQCSCIASWWGHKGRLAAVCRDSPSVCSSAVVNRGSYWLCGGQCVCESVCAVCLMRGELICVYVYLSSVVLPQRCHRMDIFMAATVVWVGLSYMKECLRTQMYDGKIGIWTHSDTMEYYFVRILLIVLDIIKFK